MIGRLRWRSLGWRTLGITLLVGLSPMLAVQTSSAWDARIGQRMQRRTEAATAELAEELAAGRPERTDRVAARWRVRLRVLDAEGALLQEADREAAPRWTDALFFTNSAPTLKEHEATLPPLAERDEVEVAWVLGATGACERSADGGLLVCHHARLSQGVLIHATESSRRGLRGLHDLRYQIARLTLICVALALVVGAALAWRIVKPIEELRAQVLSRVRPRVSTEPVPSDRDDELGDLAGAFNELLAALRARNEGYERFVVDMAHEVKNPAAAIRAAAEVLERGEPVSVERAARLSRALRASSQRLDEVITGFLELARAEGGLEAQAREPVDLGSLLEGLVEQAALPPGEGPALSLRRPEGAVTVEVAAIALESALRNLLDNGRSFARGQVEVTLRCEADRAWVSVADDGPGVAPVDAERVFERFFTTRAGAAGTGLGLAMARAVFEAHGGGLALRPSEGGPGEGEGGGGACFEGWLPLARSG